MKLFQCDHGLGDPVLALTLPAKVIAVTFTPVAVLYEVEFAAGGSHSILTPDDVKAA